MTDNWTRFQLLIEGKYGYASGKGHPAGYELCHTIRYSYYEHLCYAPLREAASVKGDDYDELVALRDRLESKIRIISPAIDMIELISARGNTSLESAVTLTKSLRWEIQSLGLRLAKAANTEELSKSSVSKTRTRAQSELEIKFIKQAIRRVLEKIEDAVPLINLAITTSGVNLSTTLPATVSPSRLLQASTFLTAGDTQYSIQPGQRVQIGPAFTLSMYMLFTAYAYRSHDQEGNMRETTWKEVIHKARVKLLRTPLEQVYELPHSRNEVQNHDRNAEDYSDGNDESSAADDAHSTSPDPPIIAGDAKVDEFAYHLLIIEDFDDDRVHSFDEDEAQPGPYEDVALAGIREVIPIHEVSKIFYADTGKILNIGSEGEINNPVLLLKRDVNAILPRRMMDRVQEYSGYGDDSHVNRRENDVVYEDEQSEVDAQLFRETSVPAAEENPSEARDLWRIPPGLDPEWIAFEVYMEHNEDEDEEGDTSEAGSTEPGPSMKSREGSVEPQLTKAMSRLHLNATSSAASSSPDASPVNQQQQLILRSPLPLLATSTFSGSGPIRSSLSLLEMLIRLTALQQFQQTSHLSIPDELLNFFLSESSSTGAGGDGEERRRKRWEARQKVGFDPYDESPLKIRGENGTAQRQAHDHYDSQEEWSSGNRTPWSRQYRGSESPSPLLVRSREALDRSTPSSRQSTPFSPQPPDRRHTSPSGPEILRHRPKILRDDSGARRQKEGSPLRRGTNVEPPQS